MKKIVLLLTLAGLTACTSLMEDRDERMIDPKGHLDDTPAPTADIEIPPVVPQVPIIAAPEPAEPLQTFTVVATDLPASELLFALARDARLNLDVDPSITGRVSINAIDQTLPQILRRVSRQVSLRYYLDGPNLVVELDKPFTRIYRIDYLNMERTTRSNIGIETALAQADQGASGDSSTTVDNEANNDFWGSLEANLEVLANRDGVDSAVVSNRESGTISIRTTAAAHEDIQRFVDQVTKSARQQVLIEATVVEVTLNDEFQGGVDWARVANGDGWSYGQDLLSSTTEDLGSLANGGPVVEASYLNTNSDRDITAAVKALDTFGEVAVMSSPKIMALNNQTSILKVADNTVYFEIDATSNVSGDSGTVTQTFNTTAKTVPVGFVMNVTPFITADNEVILNIRPTLTRILRFVPDPNPVLKVSEIVSPIPEIQVREMESVMRVASGDTAVIGGLMQDTVDQTDTGVPGLHDAEGFGILFGTKTRAYAKTELVIFLRPRVLNNASLDTNLQDFKKYLKPEIFTGE